MGMQTGGGDSHNRLPMSDINVTPFVDVMLVLLIIFMVTAPMMISGVEVDLPQASSEPISQNNEKKPLTLTVNSAGSVYIGEEQVDSEVLSATLAALRKESGSDTALVRGDTESAYGTVMKAIGALNDAGYSSISLISDPR